MALFVEEAASHRNRRCSSVQRPQHSVCLSSVHTCIHLYVCLCLPAACLSVCCLPGCLPVCLSVQLSSDAPKASLYPHRPTNKPMHYKIQSPNPKTQGTQSPTASFPPSPTAVSPSSVQSLPPTHRTNQQADQPTHQPTNITILSHAMLTNTLSNSLLLALASLSPIRPHLFHQPNRYF